MRNRLVIASFCVGVLAVFVIWITGFGTVAEREKRPLGLMTSLPIYWSGSDMTDMLGTSEEQPDNIHWVRIEAEKRHELVLLDSFAQLDGLAPNSRLAGLDYLLLAQPAALPPSDLVALDSWVRGGGRLLLFADPLLTEETDFGLGDRRRPQDMATISPLLNRWDLTETFDPEQSDQPSILTFGNIVLPVHKYGRFVPDDITKSCTIASSGVIAICTIEQGRVTIILDAHVLARDPETSEKNRALRALMDTAFSN